MSESYDAVVVGSGPNGLATGIRLAQEKLSVLIIEANETIGGGIRSAEITAPGFIHDICSAIHPLGIASPFFRKLGLENHGLRWIHPEFPLAHPLPDGDAAILHRSIEETGNAFGADKRSYASLFTPLVSRWDNLAEEFLQPMLHWPAHPILLARFGINAMRSAAALAQGRFTTQRAQALFAGLAAHSFLPLDQMPSAAFGLVLGSLGHAVGWPLPQGGAQRIADALAACFKSLGGKIQTGFRVESLDQLPRARATLLDVTPRQLLQIAGNNLSPSYRKALERFRYGPGVFKLDYALHAPIPWRSQECRRAGTVHVGGTFDEVSLSEQQVTNGAHPEKPFALLAQPSLFDNTRAPEGKHTAWAYCHVPGGSTVDMTERIERQIERFAPGFRDCVLARHSMNCSQIAAHNANLVQGDINGGLANLKQLIARPVLSATPYRTSLAGLYLCSASTPPGGGVHGMCGFHAAEAALRDRFA